MGILTSRRKSSDSDIICGRYSEHGPLDPQIAKLRKTTKIWKEIPQDFSRKKLKEQNRNDSSSDHQQQQQQQQKQSPIATFSPSQLKVNCNSQQMIMESRDHDNPVALYLEPVELSNKSSLTAANAKFNILAPPKLACHRRLKKRNKKVKKAASEPKPRPTTSKPQPRSVTSSKSSHHYDTFKNPLPIKPSFPVNSSFATAKFPLGRYQAGRGDAMTKKIPLPNSQSGKKRNSVPLAHFVHKSPKRRTKVKKTDSTGNDASSSKLSLVEQRQQPLQSSLPDSTDTMDAALVLSSFMCQQNK